MRLCVPIPCVFGQKDFCEAVRAVAAIGYDAVETYRWQDLDLPAVRDTLSETGVEMLSICTTEFRLTTPACRPQFLAGLRESCEAAKFLGVKRLITQVGQDTGAPREEQHASIVAGLREARPILAKAGVTLMIEPLNTRVNHPGYYLPFAAEAFAIIDEVGDERVKVVYDIYHQQVMEGNIIPTVTENLSRIAHLHAAGHPGRIEPWLGETDYGVVFAALDRAGYAGACGLEYRPTLPPEESLREAFARYAAK